MIGEIRQNFTEASASVGLILATALLVQNSIILFHHYISAKTIKSYCNDTDLKNKNSPLHLHGGLHF